MTTARSDDLVALDRALLGLRRFLESPAVLDDQGRRIELSTLLVLDAVGEGAASVGDIADRLDVARSTASRLVVRAERVGMVARSASPQDARAVLVGPTDAGRALGRRAREFRLERLVALTGGWDAADVTALAGALRRFAECAASEQGRRPGPAG
ncbi:MarR family transcriptional regulator [Actinotalea sp.]|uniref:MarR family winged helix-turn-helix transcriptional regulator n=1 Tax=Actinotalea sp. TaxID=1872145 RepID=UPI002C19647D|nr:MarR family transcriptional regulator [Actinotalea sp.]HQY32626.1 MarR family transcriptional regulator [Actinotalea sp.]HRA51091.1 MarR family transcriptional regulator [Actinotalea sp.]